MKVLMLCSSYPRHIKDSASIFLRHLAQSVRSNETSIHVLAPDDMNTINKIQDKHIEIHHFQYFSKRWQCLAYGSGILPNIKEKPVLALLIPFFLISMFVNLFRLCRKIKPDLIHAHWIIPQGFIAVIIGKLLNIPVITTTHGGDAFSLNNRLLSSLKCFVINNSTAWTSNTIATAKAAITRKKCPYPVIIPMGVDTSHFSSTKKQTVKNRKKMSTLLFVGRLVEKKGVRYLIEAFDLLPDNLKNSTELWIIGDGNERSALENQAKQLQLNKKIKFLGKIENNLLPKYYSEADIFIAPSIIDQTGDTEGQGVVIIEAMASCIPVIATIVGGIEEVITHYETGILIPPNNPAEICRYITELLENDSLRKELSLAGAKLAKQRYSWEVIGPRFQELYKSISCRDSLHQQ